MMDGATAVIPLGLGKREGADVLDSKESLWDVSSTELKNLNEGESCTACCEVVCLPFGIESFQACAFL